MNFSQRLFYVSLFAIALAFVESSVVVYLRALYYPAGFAFPLKLMPAQHVTVELARELSTIVMLAAVGIIAGTTRWSRFAYFAIAFGVWDIFYYVWLKVTLNWPSSLFEWDALFLIPTPWIGPVIAPILISLLMTVTGFLIIRKERREGKFHPSKGAWILSVIGTAVILYSFMSDLDATLRLQMPKLYRYELLTSGMTCYLLAMYFSFRRAKAKRA